MIKKSDIKKYSDGWWLTLWLEGRGERIKTSGPFNTKDEADHDREVINHRRKTVKIHRKQI